MVLVGAGVPALIVALSGFVQVTIAPSATAPRSQVHTRALTPQRGAPSSTRCT
jgi:hypothetical protein